MTGFASRLREAREYLGLTREQVTEALGWRPGRLAALEDGATPMRGIELRQLSRAYRRPVDWLLGNSRWQPDPELLRKTENLTEGDREAILDFAEFVEGAGQPPGREPVFDPLDAVRRNLSDHYGTADDKEDS